MLFRSALHQSRNERDGHWVLGRTLPDLKLSLLLKRHNCIELSYLDPRIVRQVRPLPGVSRTCAVMTNSLENPVHMNLVEELRKRPVRLRLKQARPAAKLPPSWVYSLQLATASVLQNPCTPGACPAGISSCMLGGSATASVFQGDARPESRT